MTMLYAGLLLLLLPHFLVYTQARDMAVRALGERVWRALFNVISLVAVGLIIAGYWGTRAGPAAADILWYPPDSWRHLTMLLVLLAFLALAASFTKGYLKLWLRNPMSVGVGLWAAGHLLVNGKRASVILFASLLLLSVVDIAVNTARGTKPTHTPRIAHDVAAIALGLALFAFFLLIFHPYILNLPVIQ
jgi:uncharacterized membrane protein